MQRLAYVILTALILTLAGGLPAVAGTTGTITGTVVDSQTGAAVANVAVAATAPSGSQSTITNSAGFYTLQQLIPDTYIVTFRLSGYEPGSAAGITVQQDQVSRVDQKLSKSLKEIGSVEARSAGNLLKGYTGTDVYNVSGQQLNTATGGDNLHRTVYEYLDTVPGITPIGGGYPAEPSIRGGYDVDNGYELDGIPITERQTGFFTTNLTNLGVSNVEVFTGGLEASNAGNGLGIINTVAKTGRTPAFGSISYGMTTPDFNHYLRLEYGNATADHRWSYYLGFDGANSQNDYNLGSVSFDLNQVGISSGNPGYIYTRDFLANVHFKPTPRNDFQFFYQNSLFNGGVNYGLYSGTPAAPLLGLAPCPGWTSGPTKTNGTGGTAPNGQPCPVGLYWTNVQNGSGNFIGHYSGIGKIQWNHILNDHSSLTLRLAENFNQYIFDQKLSDANYAYESHGSCVFPAQPGTPEGTSNGLSTGSPCTNDLGDYYQNRYGNDYYLSADYSLTPNANLSYKFGAGQEYDNQKRDVRFLNKFDFPGKNRASCYGHGANYPCINALTDIPSHVMYLYGQATMNTGKFTFEPGLRYSAYSYGLPTGSRRVTFLAPSILGTYRLNSNNVFRFSYATSGQFIGTEFVYRLNSTTYNPANIPSQSLDPQVNHVADFMWEHQFDSDTSMRVGPYYRATNNYLASFTPLLGIDPITHLPKYGDPELANNLKIRSLGIELGVSHLSHAPTGMSWWVSGSYNNYWTQVSGANGGQTSFINFPLTPNFTQAGIYVRGNQQPLFSGTFSADIHSHGTHFLPVVYYSVDNFYNTGACLDPTITPDAGPPVNDCASAQDDTGTAPVLAPEGIGGGYWYVNATLLKELNSRYTVGIRATNITDNEHGTTPCWNALDSSVAAPNVGTGCFGLNGPRSGTRAPVGYIYQNLTQDPRRVEFFVNIKM